MQSSMYRWNQTLSNLFVLACINFLSFSFLSVCRISLSSHWQPLLRRWMPSWKLFHSRKQHLLYSSSQGSSPILFPIVSFSRLLNFLPCYLCSFPSRASHLSFPSLVSPPSDTSLNLCFPVCLSSFSPLLLHFPPLSTVFYFHFVFTLLATPMPFSCLIFTHVFTIYRFYYFLQSNFLFLTLSCHQLFFLIFYPIFSFPHVSSFLLVTPLPSMCSRSLQFLTSPIRSQSTLCQETIETILYIDRPSFCCDDPSSLFSKVTFCRI